MKTKRIIDGSDFILHGGDYNPDQWLDRPDIIDEDFRLMELAGCNTFSIGIFSWTRCEPEEGRYEFGWLDNIMDRLAAAGHRAILATPSGAKPAWLSVKYPEIRRVNRDGLREPHRARHNHCWSSPVYREKVQAINAALAQRYQGHPALAMWHVSNEYNDACYCDLCIAAFQRWLERKHGTLAELNRRWWSSFWNHIYTDWNQIDPRDDSVDAMLTDWSRFHTDQVIDFYQAECRPLERFCPGVPRTTNLMGFYGPIDYWKLVAELDVVADDSYPALDRNKPTLWQDVADLAMVQGFLRTAAKRTGRPWLLMESTPSIVQWKPAKLKAPGECQAVRFAAGLQTAGTGICEMIHAEGAEVLAEYAGDFYAGQPAATRHAFGQGQAFYMATELAEEGLRALYGQILGAAGLADGSPCVDKPDHVSVCRRGRFVFITNWSPEPARLDLGENTIRPFGESEARGGGVSLDPFECLCGTMEREPGSRKRGQSGNPAAKQPELAGFVEQQLTEMENRKGFVMKTNSAFLLALALPLVAGAGRETVDFNADWRFARFGAMPDGTELAEPAGLENPALDDSAWRRLDVPHDWGIEGPFRAELPNQTGKLPWAGIGWYRKAFEIPAADQGRRIFVDFDGAMSDSTVFLNGKKVGGWPYGYASFRLELTGAVNFGGKNVLAVRLDNKPESSRWYPGGGIYRNVRLVKTAPVHVDHWGVYVHTPQVSEKSATVAVQVDVENPTDRTEVAYEVCEPGSGKVVARGKGASSTVEVKNPRLWDLATPNLYVLKTRVFQDGKMVDEVETTFGIRSIEYTADRGFLLNGRVVKMNGVCQHHDLGPLGSAVNTRALERQVAILKEMGCNAIRTSHNPPAPELLDLCDRMGVLVQVEAFDCWEKGKNPNDYGRFFPEWHEKDLRAMIRRDRNHPCVVMWSTGNEIKEQGNPEGHTISQRLTDIAHDEDPSRLVTAGCNNVKAGMNGFEKTVDLFGYNYKPHNYAEFRAKNPDQPLHGSETASCISSRGEYFFPVSNDKSQGCGGDFQVSSYDLYAPPWATTPDTEFAAQDKFPWVFGEFVWTGFDYLGEPTPYNKDKTNLLNFSDPAERKRMEDEMARIGGNIPSRSSYFGIIDLCGFPKDRYYLYQSRWRPELPMAHILPHWNWPERTGEVTPVHVYTSGDEAELFLNGKSLGRKKKGPYEYRLRWDDVVYQPGTLQAVAYKKGKPWAIAEMKTTGTAAKVELAADRGAIAADGKDLSFVTVKIADRDGLLVPRTDNLVEFRIEGPGEIVAVGNGNAASHEPFIASQRKAFNGLCLVVVRAKKGETGTITLSATSGGLQDAVIELVSK